jgi:hypothetical protein
MITPGSCPHADLSTRRVAHHHRTSRQQISDFAGTLAQADADERRNQTRLTSVEKEKLAQLRRDKRRPGLEVGILKRAGRRACRSPSPVNATYRPATRV